MKIILAPHLDDEVIGCYSIWSTLDRIYYFHQDYRANTLPDGRYMPWGSGTADTISEQDTVYLPSKYDMHPLHRRVRCIGLSLPGKKFFYNVEMNVPWLQEENNPKGKRRFFKNLYPLEYETINKSDKYFLFKSIQPFDDIIWAVIKFQREMYHCWAGAPDEVSFLRNKHRHLFYFEVKIQQFGDDRDLEYFILSRKIQQWFDKQKWKEETSCEMFAMKIKVWLEVTYPDRLAEVSVFEDNENGALIQ